MNTLIDLHRFADSDSFDQVPAAGASVIRKHSRSFSAASWLLPREYRRDVEKLYAWCRWCDDAVDSATNINQAEKRLEILREDVERIYRGQRPLHEASQWLADLVASHDIEKRLPLELLAGMTLDLRLGQIGTQEELLRYCYHAAGVVGLMLCRVFGVNDPRALRHAKSLGMAMQLTNIARDVREDWDRGRCYLPADWFAAKDAGNAIPTDAQIRDSVRCILDLADQHYRTGNLGLRYLPPGVRPAIRMASAVYREIGQQIRRRSYRVMQGRTIVPKARFTSAAAGSLLASAWSQVNERFPLKPLSAENFFHQPQPQELIMSDAKYLFYLGLSLTAFMASGSFLLVMLNPKDASYSSLPLIYAVASLGIGIVTNLLAKRAEKTVPIPITTPENRRT